MKGFHAVPRRSTPSVVIIDSGTRGRTTPRFLNLVIRAWREWDACRTEEPVRYLETS